MSSELTVVLYVIAAGAAGAALLVMRAKAWYLHVIALLLGMMAGLMPPIGDNPAVFYVIAGCAFFFFCSWGLGGILFGRTPPLRDAHNSDATELPPTSRSGGSSARPANLSSPRARAAR